MFNVFRMFNVFSVFRVFNLFNVFNVLNVFNVFKVFIKTRPKSTRCNYLKCFAMFLLILITKPDWRFPWCQSVQCVQCIQSVQSVQCVLCELTPGHDQHYTALVQWVQGVTKRKEKSNSLFWHENAIKIFFSTQIIICHMHPFTLVTKTYL